MTQSSTAVDVAEAVADWFNSLFTDLESLQTTLTAKLGPVFAGEPPHRVPPEFSKKLRGSVVEHLKAHPLLDGAGLIFQLELLQPEFAQLEWWIRDGDRFTRQEFVLDPASERFYDYEYLEWFSGAFTDERRTIAAPYIDHLGVDDYVATMTVPAYIDGRKVGVAGMDMLMHDLEAKLLRLLAPLGPGAAVLGRHSQVLVGSSGQLSSGVRVSAIPDDYARLPITADQLGLSLLYRV